jgi:glycerophosphoryl diester phosphodiesterase
MKPLVIAHRGASAYAPENTLAAFNLAFEMGADGIELDVEMTRDRIPMILHQSDPQQPTHGIRSLAQMTFKQVKEIDIGAQFDSKFRGEKIPTLAEALDAIGARGRIIIEIKRFANENKNDGREQIIAGVIRQAKTANNIIVSSFHPLSLYWFAQASPQIPRAFIYHKKIMPGLLHGFWFRWLTRPAELHIDETMATQKYVRWAQSKNYKIVVYHPDDPEPMRRYLAMGVDGIMSNKPDVLRRTVDQYYSQSKGQ